MSDTQTGDPGQHLPKRAGFGSMGWDPSKAAGAITLGALAFIVLTRFGFRGVTAKIGG